MNNRHHDEQQQQLSQLDDDDNEDLCFDNHMAPLCSQTFIQTTANQHDDGNKEQQQQKHTPSPIKNHSSGDLDCANSKDFFHPSRVSPSVREHPRKKKHSIRLLLGLPFHDEDQHSLSRSIPAAFASQSKSCNETNAVPKHQHKSSPQNNISIDNQKQQHMIDLDDIPSPPPSSSSSDRDEQIPSKSQSRFSNHVLNFGRSLSTSSKQRNGTTPSTKRQRHCSTQSDDAHFDSEVSPPDNKAEHFSESKPPLKRRRIVVAHDESRAPSTSNNSEYFSFSRYQRQQQQIEKTTSSSIPSSSHKQNSSSPPKRPRYYTRAFNFVIEHVISRYADILKPDDIDLAHLLRVGTNLTDNSLAFFVRLYRRKQPQWFRFNSLLASYSHELDVDAAIRELCEHNLLISSLHAIERKQHQKDDDNNCISLLMAIQMLPILSSSEVRSVCSSLADCAKLKRMPKQKLLPALNSILHKEATRLYYKSDYSQSKSQQQQQQNKRCAINKFKQSTLTGQSPAQRLAHSILKCAGHCVQIANTALVSLKRIHFLFFLEDGHDSPNVILADTGKVKFPNYVCHPSEIIFLTAQGYEDYENALEFERRLDMYLEAKNYQTAADFGSIAELEIREYLKMSEKNKLIVDKNNRNSPSSSSSRVNENHDENDSSKDQENREATISRINDARKEDEEGGSEQEKDFGWLCSSNVPQDQRSLKHLEANTQLKHPFFRRYTALWVYVRACWHSIYALERLGEYETAISWLQLLLRTDLMARRRGKCLNRLTINLDKHVKRTQEALDIIIQALQPDSPRLNFGDRMQLASRGANMHRKLYLPVAEKAMKLKKIKRNNSDNGGVPTRKKMVIAEIIRNRPDVISGVLKQNETKIPVQKIYGRSVNVQMREQQQNQLLNSSNVVDGDEDPWQKFISGSENPNSRDSASSMLSVRTTTDNDKDNDTTKRPSSSFLMGKSYFESFRGKGEHVSVEQYSLEWYVAREGWQGVHDEGGAIRFLFCLLMWESAVFKNVSDVFQTPYQDRPLDLMTEAFYTFRKDSIEQRLEEILSFTPHSLHKEIKRLYQQYDGTRAVGCAWNVYSSDALACIGLGLGTAALARCCALLAEDYSYWAGGLPDLTLWRSDGHDEDSSNDSNHAVTYNCRLVEVKSARDSLSDKQRAWLFELSSNMADVQVCKVVERVTSRNASELEDAKLSFEALQALTTAEKGNTNALDV